MPRLASPSLVMLMKDSSAMIVPRIRYKMNPKRLRPLCDQQISVSAPAISHVDRFLSPRVPNSIAPWSQSGRVSEAARCYVTSLLTLLLNHTLTGPAIRLFLTKEEGWKALRSKYPKIENSSNQMIHKSKIPWIGNSPNEKIQKSKILTVENSQSWKFSKSKIRQMNLNVRDLNERKVYVLFLPVNYHQNTRFFIGSWNVCNRF